MPSAPRSSHDALLPAPVGLRAAPPPRWARIVDALCLAIVVLAGIIAMSGGFRVRFGSLRIALTSPYRLLIWAVALGALRHLLARGTPIYRGLPLQLAAAWRTAAMRTAWSAAIGTRPAILFVGYLAIFMIGYAAGAPPFRLAENEFVNLQMRWDTGWYLGIAWEGYSFIPNRPEFQQNIVFFPAFPILMRIVGRLLGGASTAFALGGTLVSWFAFLGGLTYLYRLAVALLDSEDAARRSVWLIAAFPFAIFYGAIYTESLYLLGAVGAFYHFRRQEWWRVAGWGLLVGLTRPNGCFLSIPLAVLALEPWLPAWLVGAQRTSRPDEAGVRSLVTRLAAASAPGVGVLLYCAYIWRLTGNPIAWAEGHLAWGRSYQGLGALVSQRYEWLSQGGLYAYTAAVPNDLINGLAALFVLGAVWPVARRLGLAYAVFILVNILPPLAAGGLLSAGRFASVLFPAFVWLGAALPARHQPACVATFMALQAFNAALFYTWRPMF
jgi:hypothetical protein